MFFWLLSGFFFGKYYPVLSIPWCLLFALSPVFSNKAVVGPIYPCIIIAMSKRRPVLACLEKCEKCGFQFNSVLRHQHLGHLGTTCRWPNSGNENENDLHQYHRLERENNDLMDHWLLWHNTIAAAAAVPGPESKNENQTAQQRARTHVSYASLQCQEVASVTSQLLFIYPASRVWDRY